MLEMKVRKQVTMNEQGSADIIFTVEYKNKSHEPERLSGFAIKEDRLDVVNIQVRDSKGKSLPFDKIMKEDFIRVGVNLHETILEANETYLLIFYYTIPSMIKRFNKTYFYKELEVWSEWLEETCEWTVTYKLPKLFNRYEFWKEMYVNAPQCSRIDVDNGHKILEHRFVLPRGSHRECSFMFQERYNSRTVALLSFLMGVTLLQFFEWLATLIF